MASPNKYNKAFGRALRKLRKNFKPSPEHSGGISQEALGFDSGLTRAYISLLERGLRSPTLDTMMPLCSSLGVTLVVLATLIEEELKQLEHATPK